MNRTCHLTVGAIVLVACATGAHDAGATGPTVPAPTVTVPNPHPTLHISVGAPTTVGVSSSVRVVPRPIAIDQNAPFEQTFVGSGSRFYLAAKGYDSHGVIVESDIYASADSGKTWTTGAVYPTPNQSCANVAIDAGNPNVVYLTYYSGHANTSGNSGTTLRLAVSTDGGMSFPTSYVIADSGNSMANLICPDVISPKSGTVIVAATVVNSSGTASHSATWVGNAVHPIGPSAVPSTPSGVYVSSTDTNASSEQPCLLGGNSSRWAPRLLTNGNGAVCVTYAESSGCTSGQNARFIQCSKDSGATWTARRDIGAGSEEILSGAMSPSGSNVALAWMSTAGEINLTISRDGGLTFPGLRQYPPAYRTAIVASYTGRPVVTWENDTALWLAQTLNQSDNPVLMLDRTGDNGLTWFGAVNAGPYMGTSLLSTGSGMVATGYGKGTLTSVVLPLSLR